MDHVGKYCQWAESEAHNLEEVYPILLALVEGAPGLKTVPGFPPERTFPGLPAMCLGPIRSGLQTLPFSAIGQCFGPMKCIQKGLGLTTYTRTLRIFSPNSSTDYNCWSKMVNFRRCDTGVILTSFIGGIMHPPLFGQ